MAGEKDQPGWLPDPPPPRPACRDQAINAAMRRFDGLPDERPQSRVRPRSGWWGFSGGPQLTALVSAMLLVIVAIPATFIGLRNEHPPAQTHKQIFPPQETVAPAPIQESRPAAPVTEATPERGRAPTATTAVEQRPSRIGVAGKAPADVASLTDALPPAPAPAAPAIAAPPAPPPPPPPPPPPAAEAQSARDVVVTGSRVRSPQVAEREQQKANNLGAFAAPSVSNDALHPSAAELTFLARLQGAVKAGDRRAILKLIAYPLRVNGAGGARLYKDRKSVEGDFDLIFTPRVRQAILDQRGDALFVRDQGAMIGNGELWFSETCTNAECSPPGAVLITAVNP